LSYEWKNIVSNLFGIVRDEMVMLITMTMMVVVVTMHHDATKSFCCIIHLLTYLFCICVFQCEEE